MEERGFHFYQIMIVALMCCFISSKVFMDTEGVLTLWNYMNGHGVCNRSVFDDTDCCQNNHCDDYNVPEWMGLCNYFPLCFVTFLAVVSTYEAKLQPEEKMNIRVLVTVAVFMLVVFVMLLTMHRLISARKHKIEKKMDDEALLEYRENDLGERFVSEELSLHMIVRMKPMKKDSILATKGMKDGSFFPALKKGTLDHLFKFRRDQNFEQTVIAAPATINLASHFASGTYGQPGSVQELNKEGVRLSSFKDFPTRVPVSAIRLAQAGFYFLGEGDIVKCFSCGETYQGWQVGDRPALVHARISPNCSLVRGCNTVNVPLPLPITNRPNFEEPVSMDSGFESHVPPATAQSEGTVGPVEMDAAHGPPMAAVDNKGRQPAPSSDTSVPTLVTSFGRMTASDSAGTSSLTHSENSTLSGVPLSAHAIAADGSAPRNMTLPGRRLDLGGAVYPLYSQMDARKRSFSGWVVSAELPDVEELIRLGFFYAGYADCVRCFFCGIGLKSWEPGDIPAEVHARWRPTCEYLRLVKGDEFVDLVANGARNIGRQSLSAGGSGQTGNANAQQGRDSAQNSSSSSSQPGTTSVPDVPAVHRAREAGYTDQQIAEAIEKLRIIGMEAAIDIMLVEILTNLFNSSSTRTRRNEAANQSSPSTANNSNNNSDASNPAVAPARNSDMQQDGAPPDEVPDNGAATQARDQGGLQERHNALQQENARLRDMRTCQRCHERPVAIIFLPCGHIIACATCAPSMRRCTRCDSIIRATANVYFS